MSLLKSAATGRNNGSSIGMGAFDEIWLPQDSNSIAAAEAYFALSATAKTLAQISYKKDIPACYPSNEDMIKTFDKKTGMTIYKPISCIDDLLKDIINN
jgi:hypothetical protein